MRHSMRSHGCCRFIDGYYTGPGAVRAAGSGLVVYYVSAVGGIYSLERGVDSARSKYASKIDKRSPRQ